MKVPVRKPVGKLLQLQRHDSGNLLLSEPVEDDYLIDSVDELGLEGSADDLHHGLVSRFHIRSLHELAASQVAGHDDDRVGEIDKPSLPVGEPSVVQDLEQDVEHVGMGLLDLIEENH